MARPATDPAQAQQELGLKAYTAKDFLAAERFLSKAVELRPGVALWHSQLGVTLRSLGRPGEAAEAHRRAVALEPGLALAHNNLGNVLRDLGDLAGSQHHLSEAIRLAPNYPEAAYNLAITFRRLNNYAEAEKFCARALELSPQHLDARNELGNLLRRRSDFAGAEKCFRVYIEMRRDQPAGYLNLATTLEAMGRFDEADEIYDRAREVAPDLPEVRFAVGRRLEQRGDLEGAAVEFRAAIAGRPELSTAYLALADLPRLGLTEEERQTIRTMLERNDLSEDDRANFCFALARSYERAREWDKAFAWVRQGNRIEHKRTAFSEQESLAFAKSVAANFPRDVLSALPQGSDSERPIFVIGMPRSGTTLVEQIIASHPEAVAGGELVEIPEMVKELPALTGTSRPFPDCVLDMGEPLARRLAERYLARLDRVDPGAARVVDKLPFNFRNLGLITSLFPRARIIHCRRDPRDVAVSCYFIKFHRPISFAYDLFELGAYLRHYEEIMRHWRKALTLPMLEVQYESLVADTETHIRRIVDFCGLEWNERCLAFHEADRMVRTASVNQVRRPIYSGSIGRWQRYAKHLVPLFAELEGKMPPRKEARLAQ